MNTIAEAKQHLRANFEKGTECPCCGQFVKLYKRKLNSGMAITLIRIFNRGSDWVNVKEFLRQNKFKNSHDWTLLKYWGLLEESDKSTNDRNSGSWKITEQGVRFVKNELSVKKHLYFFDSRSYGFSDETTNIMEALGNKFNYYELLSA